MNYCSWGKIMTQEVLEAVKEAKEQSKPRNFTQSVDMIINVRDLDVKKPENRFNEEVTLPNGRGKDVKIGVIADGELIVQAKDAGVALVINKDDLEALGKDRKQAKSAANSVDFFIAQADMMPLVGRFLGPILGPRNKMPKPVPASIKLDPLLERLQSLKESGAITEAEFETQKAKIKLLPGRQFRCKERWPATPCKDQSFAPAAILRSSPQMFLLSPCRAQPRACLEARS